MQDVSHNKPLRKTVKSRMSFLLNVVDVRSDLKPERRTELNPHPKICFSSLACLSSLRLKQSSQTSSINVSNVSLNTTLFTKFLGNKCIENNKFSICKTKSLPKGAQRKTTMGLLAKFGQGNIPPIWTTLLLAVNTLMFIGSYATKGRLTLWGAKVNFLIANGQWWRFFTCALLHADIIHLLVNSVSLRNIGSSLERVVGGPRFLAIYWISALAGSYASYRFSPGPSVGASGAIMGLVGAQCVFLFRHRDMLTVSGHSVFTSLLQTIVSNLAFGYFVRNVDNWGHLGGLFGGVACAWILGPVWRVARSSGQPMELSLLQRLGFPGL